jgi:fructose-bisphosphate aldolase class I
VEPEVDINSPTKVECDDLLKAEILAGLDKLGADEKVIFKLAIPSKINHYRELMDHPKVICVVALSVRSSSFFLVKLFGTDMSKFFFAQGGYSRDEASKLLSKQTGMIASFSRALLEGLNMNRAMKNSTRPLPCR